jgi:ribose 5-phosphate isomerase B
MKIAIGSDHRGHEQRQRLTEILKSGDHKAIDCGYFGQDSADYPDIAVELCRRVVAGEVDRGILVCGTGIGMSIAANKVDGIRAALVCSVDNARLASAHNRANVICLAGNNFDPDFYRDAVNAWLEAEFEGGRHARRLDKVAAIPSCGSE